jgi:hypothetical protein
MFGKQTVCELECLEGRLVMSAPIGPSPNAGLLNAAQHANAKALANSQALQMFVPEVTSVSISADNAANVTTLTVTPTADALGPVTFTYQWLQNGDAINGATSQTINLQTQVADIDPGDEFSVVVTPTSQGVTGDAFTSAPVVIATASPDPITLVP